LNLEIVENIIEKEIDRILIFSKDILKMMEERTD
jgi:hypothetical protein